METKSRRARRMERHHKMHRGAPLNLVSLMDIFTILVFFLLVNSSNTPELPRQRDLSLPKSIARQTPGDALILLITPTAFVLQGRQIATVSEVEAQPDAPTIEPLAEALRELRGDRAAEDTAPITIMGDANIAFGLLNRVLATCQAEQYTRIAFAAEQRAGDTQ